MLKGRNSILRCLSILTLKDKVCLKEIYRKYKLIMMIIDIIKDETLFNLIEQVIINPIYADKSISGVPQG